MKIVFIALAALSLSGPDFAQTVDAHEHGDGAAPATAGAQGSGVVKSVDAKAGTITLHHGPITALGWPAMTMTFKAAPDVLKAAKSGQTVGFTLNAAANQVVSIR